MTITIEPLADDAVLLRFGERIDPDLNAQVLQLAARLRDAGLPWLRDVVPAYASVAVFFDSWQLDAEAIDGDPHAHIAELLLAQLAAVSPATASTQAPRTVEIPVCYGGDHGADLDSAAVELGITVGELIQRHTAGHYTVAMIGFAPGFPYLLGLDPALALPRLATPRTQVPAGSVAIGGAQTGIYPRASAGGWRLLGRTPLTLFDPARNEPALLTPGDQVRFVAIDAAQFDALSQ